MAITSITPVEVGPTTANIWEAVDLSSLIPAGATGVIIHIVNNTVAGNRIVGVRKTGSADDIPDVLRADSHIWAVAGVNASRQADFYTANLSNIDFYVTGYFEGEAVFFDTFVSKTIAPNTWETVDISADTGADTAIAAFFVWTGGSVSHGARMFGSTDNRISNAQDYLHKITGVDGSERCELYQGGAASLHLIGYLKDTANAVFHTNATDMSLGTTGAWTDLAALPAGATGGLFEIYDGTNSNIDFGLRKNGSAEDIVSTLHPAHAWAIVEADASQLVEGQIANLSVDFFLIGYITSAGADLIKVRDETVQAFEAILRPMTLARIVGTTTEISEAAIRSLAIARILAETEEVSEAFSKTRGCRQVIDETVNISETIDRVLGIAQVIIEVLNISEAADKAIGIAKVITETIQTSETVARVRALVRLAGETVSESEALVPVRALVRALSETVQIVEAVVAPRVLVRIASETVSLAEAVVSTIQAVSAAFVAATLGIKPAVASPGPLLRAAVAAALRLNKDKT